MAVIFQCGFEAGSLSYYTARGWNFNAATTVTNAVSHKSMAGNGGDYSILLIDAAISPFLAGTPRWLHFWMSPEHPSSSGAVDVSFYRAGATTEYRNATVRFKKGGTLQIYRGWSGTPVLLAVGTFNPMVAHWIAIEAVCTDVGGVVTVFIDGTQALQAVGDLQYSTSPNWDHFSFDPTLASPSPAPYLYIDDIIVTDAATGRLGEHLTVKLLPDGDSAPLELTPSTPGTHFSLVNETPPSTAEYNEAPGAVNLEDNYTLAPLTFTPASIPFVAAWSYTAQNGELGIRHILTTAVQTKAARQQIASGYTVKNDIWLTDPADALPWTEAKLATAEIGVEFVA